MGDKTKATLPDMKEKIKAFEPHIIVNTSDVEPYYSIMYYDITDKLWHIGYGSFNISFVRKWLREEFEEVDVDFVEVVRCKDCAYRYTISCNAKHERADMDYCSSGLPKRIYEIFNGERREK